MLRLLEAVEDQVDADFEVAGVSSSAVSMGWLLWSARYGYSSVAPTTSSTTRISNPLKAAAEAMAYPGEGHARGKIILTI
jgi:hypothetical protein